MKKVLMLLIILFITGCTNNNKVATIIKEESSMLIGINYPITNTKLDMKIEKDINKIQSDFKNKYQSPNSNTKAELNIDYNINEFKDYISVVLNVYISSPKIDKNIEYVITYMYDKKNKKILKNNDIIDINNSKYIIKEELLKKYKNIKISTIDALINNSLIGIDPEYINIYFNPTEFNNLISIKIPNNNIKLKINITSEQINKVFNKMEVKSRVIDPNDKVIALTFDDGPSIYTEEIIEYLHENDCNGTFFVLGNKVKIYSDIIKKSISYGNEIGNHSYNHKWLIKLSEKDILDQINKTQNILNSVAGYTPTILRPTYGSTNDIIKNKTNLDVVLWNVDTMDWKYKSVNKIVARATKNLKDGNIILMHDTKYRTLEAIKKIVPILKENNYTCVTISELKEINLIRKIQNEK